MRIAGLFSGVGGLELGLDRAGHESSVLCDIDPRARVVLEERFPGRLLLGDVAEVVSNAHRLTSDIDLISAGFPCQDLSQVGTTRGLRGTRSGLVQRVFDILEKRRVPWVLLENVPFLLSLDRGRAIRSLTTSFERLGYRWAYRVLDTQAFGLPQRRRRVFLLASRVTHPGRLLFPDLSSDSVSRALHRSSKSPSYGFYWTEGTRGLGWAVDSIPPLKVGSGVGIPSAPAVWIPGGRFVTPTIEAAERLQGFDSGWTEPACELNGARYRWTLAGNAVSVPVAEWLGRCLESDPTRLPSKHAPLPNSGGWPIAAFGGGKDGSFRVDASPWPVAYRSRSLARFLGNGVTPLSPRAAKGFLDRLQKSTLQRLPDFESELVEYVDRPGLAVA